MTLSKKEKELQTLLEAYSPPDISSGRKNAALYKLKTEAGKEHKKEKTPFWLRLKIQLAYIPASLWLTESFLLIFGLWICVHAPHSNGLTTLSVASPVLGVTVFPVLARSFSEGMWELEQSSRYNLKDICCMRLLIFGLADTFIVAVLSAVIVKTGTAPYSCLLRVVVPFTVSCSVYMYLIRRIRNSSVNYILVCAGIFLCLVCLYMQKYYVLLEEILSGIQTTAVTAAALAASMILLNVQVYLYVRFIGQKGKGWDELWNYN